MELNEKLVSIIVPVYNVKPYLDQCITSVLNQTHRNIEVILVDDGSTDGSGEICKSYAQQDSRIKLLSQNNQGLTMARKNGSKLATGIYMGFVDADDYIDEDMFAQLLSRAEDFDLVISRWKRENGDDVRCAYDKIAVGAYRTQDEMNFILDHLLNVSLPGGAATILSGIASFVWNKLYKTDIAMSVFEEIDETISFVEDRDFTCRYILKCNSVLVTDICGYHYRIRSGSISHSIDREGKALKNSCKLYYGLEALFRNHPRCDSLMAQLQMRFCASLARVPSRMGFGPEAQLQLKQYIFPFLNLLDGQHIALYGAGAVGRNYCQQIRKLQICTIDVWVDTDYENYQRAGWEVSPVEELVEGDYDHIVLAAETDDEADEMRSNAVTLGVAEKKILWRKPLIL